MSGDSPDSSSKRRAASSDAPVPSAPEPSPAILRLVSPEPEPAESGLPREVIGAYLVRKEAQKRIRENVRALPFWGTWREDAAAEVALRALASRKRAETEQALPAWVDGIARNVVADAWREVYKRRKREKQTEPEVLEALPEAERDDVRFVEQRWITTFLRKELRDNPRDAETYWLLVEKARRTLTNEQIAAERGTTEAQVKSQIQRFKEKYAPRYRKYLAQLATLALLLLFVLAAIAYLIFRILASAPPSAPPVPPSELRAPSPTPPSPTPPAPQPTTEGSGVFEPATGTRDAAAPERLK